MTRFSGTMDQSDIVALRERVEELEAALAQMERARREGERQRRELEAIFMHSPTATVIVTEDGTVTAWNASAERLFGYREDEAVGRNVDDLVALPEQRREAEGYSAAAAAGPVHAVTRRVRRGGQFVDVELLAVPVLVDGRHVGTVAIYHDITALQTARREAEEQHQRFEAIFRHAPVAMITTEDDGVTVNAWNPAAEQLFGYSAAEAWGHNIDDLVSNDELRSEAEDINRRADHEGTVKAVTRRAHRDGHLVDVEIAAVSVLVEGIRTSVVALYHDVTELLHARREAEMARRQAEEANEAKSRFLSNVSHELRTPLTSVLGFAKIIGRRLDEIILPAVDTSEPKRARAVRQVRENLAIIVAEGERLTAMINNVLDLAKIESGRFEWKDEDVSIESVVEHAGNTTASLFLAKGIELRVDVEDDLPHVRGDADQLLQVVINLLSNAVKFTDAGWVEIRAGRVKSEIVVSVTDSGMGIAPEDQARVFEQFRQVGDTLTDKPRGTGLGLPIAKEIVEHHGGRMGLVSEPGRGSTFSFALPISAPASRPGD